MKSPNWASSRLPKLSVVVTCAFLMFCLTYGFGYQRSKVKSKDAPKKAYSRWNSMSKEEFQALNRYACLDRTKRIQEHDNVDGRKALDSIRGGSR